MQVPTLIDVTHRAVAGFAAVIVLVLVGFAAVVSVRPPAAQDASVPAEQFSAGRAFEQVKAIATEPHPVGSAAGDRVRERLVTRLRGLGLSPEVQDAVGVFAGAGVTGLAHVRNVVTLIPGTGSTGRIFLVAHYDSVQTGPGGNDDGAGTAAVLETARALTAGPRLRNDVVLVLTDGEEACLCGAQAFVDRHPLAGGGGIVLNLEARGSSGPAIMFETAADNRRLVDAYARTPKPVGTSFAVEIYRLLPNDTDFTAFREAGFTGLNAAYIDGAAVYHAPTDVPAAMNLDSLQHHGDTTLALARDLGGRDLATLSSDQDATYFPAPGLLVRYPGTLVWPLAVLALVAVAALGMLAVRLGYFTVRRGLAAAGLTLLPIIAAPVLAQAYWLLLTLIRPGYAALPIDPYRPQAYRLAVLAIAASVLCAWYAVLRRKIGPVALAVAGAGWLAVLGLVLAWLMPGGSYLTTLPALAAALAGITALLTRGWWAVTAVTAGAAVAVVVLLPTAIMLFPALGLKTGATGALIAVLLGLAALPVVDLLHPPPWNPQGLAALHARRRGAAPSLVAALAVLVCTAVGLRVDRFDPAHPAPTQLMYALDADDGTARWISAEPAVQQWTSQYVTGDLTTVDDTLPSFGPGRVRTGPATAASLPAPQLTMVADTRSGNTRTMTLRLKPQRQVRLASLYVADSATVTAATVDDRPVPTGREAHGGWGFGFVFHGPPADGVEIKLTLRASGPVEFRVMDGSDGLGSLPGFHARPTDVGVLGSHTSELLAVAKTYSL